MGWATDAVHDVRLGVRGLMRRPSHAAVLVMTLALGIGVNTAIFTLLHAHFFQGLPYGDAGSLVVLWETDRHSTDVTTVAPGNFFAWREQAESFQAMAAYNVDEAAISGDEGPAEQVTASLVTPEFFNVLGVRPAMGPGFGPSGARDDQERVAVLGHHLWVRRFGGDASVIGRTIRLDGEPHLVVGVMPASFRQPERDLAEQRVEVWRLLNLESRRDDHGSRYLRAVARLQPGVSVDRARAEMQELAMRLATDFPADNGGRTALVLPLDRYLQGAARPTLVLLFAASCTVLLVVCANVANLTLARGQDRLHEFAVRAALGSGRSRLVRQILVESVTVAIAGALLGLVTTWGFQGLLQVAQERFFSGLVDVGVGGQVAALTFGTAVLAGVVSGLPLASTASSADLRGSMGRPGSGTAGRTGFSSTMRTLVVGQVALATGLVAVAALLTRSFTELVDVPPGFDATDVVTFDLVAPAHLASDDEVLAYYHDLQRSLEALPAVEGVGLVSDMPFTTANWTAEVRRSGDENQGSGVRSEYHLASNEYFELLGIPLLEGRWPASTPVAPNEPAPVLVNAALAARLWPERSAVGETFELNWRNRSQAVVVGVVGDVLDDGFDAPAEPAFYVPFAVRTNRAMSLVVRAAGERAVTAAAIQEVVSQVDPDVPVARLRSVERVLAETVARPRAASLLGSGVALLALIVAVMGIYGVLAYAVRRRTRELAIRAALGASGPHLVTMVMGQSFRLLVVGLVLGCGLALAAGPALSGLLFGVRPWDPASLGAALALLGAGATLATWLPARRAVRVQPQTALRSD